MLSKNYVIIDMNDVHYVLSVMLLEILKNLQLHTSLIIVLFLVFDYLNGYVFLLFVIDASQSCAKRTLSEEFYNFVTVANMVSHDDVVITFVIVVSVVMVILLVLLTAAST